MNTHADKTQENKNQSVANEVSQKQSGGKSTFQFIDNRPEAIAQKKLQEMANNSSQVKPLRAFQEIANNNSQAKQAAQMQAIADNYSAKKQPPIQKRENKTGMPDKLKSGIENLSGYSMNDVKVHYNSSKPAQLQAHAYAQGADIHLASGQEKHLPHEAWHVVQQKQGRVKPTLQMKGGVNVNDDKGLEQEADLMGTKALQMRQVVQCQLPGDENSTKDPTPEEKLKIEELGGTIQAKLRNPSLTNTVVQRAYTARRPLGGKISFGLGSRWIRNKGVFHEHIFFEDKEKPGDIGFHNGSDKLFQDSPNMMKLYKKIKIGLDDGAMRDAVKAVGDPGSYSLLGNNCQAYVGKVLAAYKEPIEMDSL